MSCDIFLNAVIIFCELRISKLRKQLSNAYMQSTIYLRNRRGHYIQHLNKLR